MGGRGSGGAGGGGARGGGGGGAAQAAQPKQKNLVEKAKDGDLTSADFNKMDSGSRAYLLGQTPRGTVVTASNGTQYKHTGDNKWSRNGGELVFGKVSAKTAVTNSYVAAQTANGRMKKIRYI